MDRTGPDRQAARESWVMLFLLFSAAGWLWEVLLTRLVTGQWVNRGMLHGPWLPVYGVGGVLLAGLLDRFRGNQALLCLLSALAGGGVEYLTALLLERRFALRWWDYSGAPGNIHGRICPASLLGFALAGWAAVSLSPGLRRRFARWPDGLRRALCRTLALLLALDWTLSLLRPNTGAGITLPP